MGLLRALPARVGGLVRGSHRGVKRGELTHHVFVLILLIGVHGLRMLAQIVEAGELLATVACEGPLTRVFPGWWKGVSEKIEENQCKKKENIYLIDYRK